jgi:hypothetical protein
MTDAYANGTPMTTATCTAGEHAKCDGTWRIGPLTARYLGQDEVEGPCDCECHSA